MPDKKHAKAKTPFWQGGNGKVRNLLNHREIGSESDPLETPAQPRNWGPHEGVTESGIGTSTLGRTYEARCRNCPDLY